MPRNVAQWNKLTPEQQSSVDAAQEMAIEVLQSAGITSPNERDTEMDEVGDWVQSDLQDAMLRCPQLVTWFDHVLSLAKEYPVNEGQHASVGAIEAAIQAGEADAEKDRFIAWAHIVDMAELRSARTVREYRLAGGFDPQSHWELEVITNELNKRLAGEKPQQPSVNPAKQHLESDELRSMGVHHVEMQDGN